MRKIPPGYLDGGVGQIPGNGFQAYGAVLDLPTLLRSIAAEADGLTVAAAQALTEADWAGRPVIGGKPMRWDADSLVNDDTGNVAVKPDALEDDEPGRFVLEEAFTIITVSFTFETADGAALFVVPDGVVLDLLPPYAWWFIDGASFTGGAGTPAIGLHTSKSGLNTKGDLLGGKAGDVAAALVKASPVAPNFGTPGSLACPARGVFRENAAVASAAATPRFAIEQLLYAKTIGTGAAGVKAALINGGTPSAGEAAPNAGGTSVAFNAETTGTGTVDLWYLTNAGVTFENTPLVGDDEIRFGRVSSQFAAGSGKAKILAAVTYL